MLFPLHGVTDGSPFSLYMPAAQQTVVLVHSRALSFAPKGGTLRALFRVSSASITALALWGCHEEQTGRLEHMMVGLTPESAAP